MAKKRIIAYHSRLNRTLEADDIFDIASTLVIWGDPKEWGTICQPSIHQSEVEYLKDMEKEGFTININN